MYVFDESFGEVDCYISGDETLEAVSAPSFIDKLEGQLSEEALDALRSSVKNQKIPIESLENQGFSLIFHVETISLELNIPTNMLKQETLSFNKSSARTNSSDLEPGNWSGYLNYDYRLRSLDDERRDWFNELYLDAVLNIHGAVLESGMFYSEDNSVTYDRAFVTYDHAPKALRFRIGELNTESNGLQNTFSVAGFSFESLDALGAGSSDRANNDKALELRERSEVTIFINDQVFDRRLLRQGIYTLGELNLPEGPNNVRIKIEGQSGEVEWVEFNAPVSSKLLAFGQDQYYFAFGVPYEIDDKQRRYDTDPDARIGVASYRYGVSPLWTLGTFQQFEMNYMRLGLESFHATMLGNISLEWAWQDGSSLSNGNDVLFKYEYLFKDLRDSKFRMEHEWSSDAPDSTDAPIGNGFRKQSMSYSAKLGQSTYIGLNAGWTRFSDGQYSRLFNINLSKPLLRSLSASLQIKLGENQYGEREDGAELKLNWRPNQENFNRVELDSSSITERTELVVGYDTNAALTTNVAVVEEPQGNTLNTDWLYDFSRIKTALNTRSSFNREAEKERNDFSFQGAGAIAFGGSGIGFSHRINDSFAMIGINNNLSGQELGVNPREDAELGYSSVASDQVNAVIPNLASYTEAQIVLDSSTLETGYAIAKEKYLLKPSYKSGFFIEVGESAKVILVAKLTEIDGADLGFKTGYVSSVSNPREQHQFFTNRSGSMFVEGLASGQYEIKLDDFRHNEIILEIPADVTGFYRVGTLTLEASNE